MGGVFDKILTKINNDPKLLIQFAKILMYINYIQFPSFCCLNSTVIENGIYRGKLEPFSPTNQCNINFYNPDPISSIVGGYSWRDRDINIDIVNLVGTSQLSIF